MPSEITHEDVKKAAEGAAVKAVAIRTKQELQLETLFGDRGLAPRNLAELKNFAQEIIDSGMAPSGIKTAGQALLCMQTGSELGFTPARSLQAIVPVKGRTTLTGEAAFALIRNSGKLEPGTDLMVSYSRDPAEGLTATVSTKRRGGPWQRSSFSEEDATTAGLLPAMKWDDATRKQVPNPDSPWNKYRKRMLQWRAGGFHAKDYWSDVCMGLMLTEEARDIPSPMCDVTPIKLEERPPAPDPLFAGMADEAILDVEPFEPGVVDPGGDADIEIDPETGEIVPPDAGIIFDERDA